MSDFDQAGRLDSRAAMPHVWRGIIHWRTKKWGLAIAEFKQALEIDREDLDTSLLLAPAYVFQSDFGKAIPMISQVIAADPHFGGAYELRAVCSIPRGKYRDALHDLDESVRVEPDSPGHLALRSRLRFEVGLRE
jgi:tetratricopeptide (TPR) repeat protein